MPKQVQQALLKHCSDPQSFSEQWKHGTELRQTLINYFTGRIVELDKNLEEVELPGWERRVLKTIGSNEELRNIIDILKREI